jgi:hypothetical protein
MIEYISDSIKNVNKNGIYLTGKTFISFQDCIRNWAKEKEIPATGNICVGERNASGKHPYFCFYTQERTKIIFEKRLLGFRIKDKKSFYGLQKELTNIGFTTFDLT